MRFKPFQGALTLWAVLATLSAPATSLGQTANADQQANALFESYWEWVLREYPDSATLYFGDHRHDDKLRDESAAAVIGRNAALTSFRERSNQINPAMLSPQERISLYVLQFSLDAWLAINKGHGSLPFGVFDSWAPVTQMGGLHLDLPQLATAARFQSVSDYEAWLKRLDAVPESVARLIERMTVAMNAGWMPPKVAILGVPQQLDVQLVDVQDSPEYQPFKSFPKEMAQSEQARLARAGERVIREKVIPAFRSLKSFYEARYLERAAQHLSLSKLPGGPMYYQAWLDWYTTTHMTPGEIHRIGLAEVARIGSQMDAIVAASGFKGSRREFQEFLSSDPQFFFTRPEDMLAAYRVIG